MELKQYLKAMVEEGASDMYFTGGAPVSLRVEGKVRKLSDECLPRGEVRKLAYSVLDEQQIHQFERDLGLDFSLSIDDVGRFRVNLLRQRGDVAMVARYLSNHIPGIDELQLPAILKELALEERGLVLVAGSTGAGKSTTLASMVDHRNSNRTGHILTIEDPIEFLHEHKQSIVNQREIGPDVHSYSDALRRALREAPDVILIGEIRDRETMEHALSYANTGHLCFSTIHATNAYQALERIVSLVPESDTERLLMDLSLSLRAIISQRLVVGVEGRRIPAVEVLLNRGYVKELIQKGETENVREVMEQNIHQGMQTFDNALLQLYQEGKISADEALRSADSRTNLSLRIKLAEKAESKGSHELSLKSEPLQRGQLHELS